MEHQSSQIDEFFVPCEVVLAYNLEDISTKHRGMKLGLQTVYKLVHLCLKSKIHLKMS